MLLTRVSDTGRRYQTAGLIIVFAINTHTPYRRHWGFYRPLLLEHGGISAVLLAATAKCTSLGKTPFVSLLREKEDAE